MKLMSCTLMGFGKLYRRAYTFSDGINVIYGENESGKTTLRTFLTGMLFGLERKRGIASKKDEFHKYQPCNGGIYGGTLSVSTGDQVYQIQRNFTDVSDITVYNEKTGKKINWPWFCQLEFPKFNQFLHPSQYSEHRSHEWN